MKIICYSDLHLEFGNEFKPPKNLDADLMILAGDIITFTERGFKALEEFLGNWKKPVLYIAGNHEYYTLSPMNRGENMLKNFIEDHQNVTWLNNSEFTLNGIEFFGGTMWTDFNKSNKVSMIQAAFSMNDYRQIITRQPNDQFLMPQDTVKMHKVFKKKLIEWFKKNKGKKTVVISHHAPVISRNTKFRKSLLQGAFNSLDMIPLIEKYQPDFWIYGHTHESDNQKIGKTQIISNPFGYYGHDEVGDFDKNGCNFEI